MKNREYGGYNTFSPDRKSANNLLSRNNLYSLNLGRNALRLLLSVRKPDVIYAPYYTCYSIHNALNSVVPEVRYYHIDDKFQPLVPTEEIAQNCLILINNYFGVFEKPVNSIIEQCGGQVIIDNSQGIYSEFPSNIDQIFSPRKFFGVTDGGLLLTEREIKDIYLSLPVDKSSERIKHLFSAEETSKNSCYQEYLEYRKSIQNLELMRMSASTAGLLKSIDLEYCRIRRHRNFIRMHENLGEYNELNIPVETPGGAMCYPFLYKNSDLKHRLVQNKIYIGTYWPVSSMASSSSLFETRLRDEMCCLPIDQSMDDDDIEYVAKTVMSIINM